MMVIRERVDDDDDEDDDEFCILVDSCLFLLWFN